MLIANEQTDCCFFFNSNKDAFLAKMIGIVHNHNSLLKICQKKSSINA